jgi:hypothetical protein
MVHIGLDVIYTGEVGLSYPPILLPVPAPSTSWNEGPGSLPSLYTSPCLSGFLKLDEEERPENPLPPPVTPLVLLALLREREGE